MGPSKGIAAVAGALGKEFSTGIRRGDATCAVWVRSLGAEAVRGAVCSV